MASKEMPGYRKASRCLREHAVNRRVQGSRWFGERGLLRYGMATVETASSTSSSSGDLNPGGAQTRPIANEKQPPEWIPSKSSRDGTGVPYLPQQTLISRLLRDRHNSGNHRLTFHEPYNLPPDSFLVPNSAGPSYFPPPMYQLLQPLQPNLANIPRVLGTLPPPIGLPPSYHNISNNNIYPNNPYNNPYTSPHNNPPNLPTPQNDPTNQSFFLRNLPPTTTISTLLSAIRGIGRVYCASVRPPNPNLPIVAGSWNAGAAARLVFFDLEAARVFWELYGWAKGKFRFPFVVGGREVVVSRNRVRVGPSASGAGGRMGMGYCSRVVRVVRYIKGDGEDDDEEELDVKGMLMAFSANFAFEMDEIVVGFEERVVAGPGGRRGLVEVVEFRFGSFRGQAEYVYFVLMGRRGLEVSFGRDPCGL
ncbi:hypothetical protein B0J18DRAFT_472031 [Chaetomium sp. MPI-SDFR-AT-0129]|nr:hypothetical protein B0J18DRAFT_472031 [Chaetomium sp. MPI-SDFR-AT-0129]